MLRKRVGMILVGIGSALIVSGAAFSLAGGSADPSDRIASGAAATTAAPSTTSPAASATTAPPATTTTPTTAPTTSTTSPTTTLPPAATTTTIPPVDAVAAFIAEFGTAITNEDVDWLYSHLHPAMSLEYGEETCRGFITGDILALTQYTLTGSVAGPDTKTFSTGVGDLTISNIYTAETSFVFQGQAFDAKADFVYEDTVTWLAICR